MLRRLMLVLLCCCALLCAGCNIGIGDRHNVKIGVAMPTQTRQRWNQDGANIERMLLDQGYSVNLAYADNKPEVQVGQIDDMIEAGCKVIIIACVDANSLGEVLDKAKDVGTKIISYDRLIMNTDAADYYATFDSLAVGTFQAEYIEEKLGLKWGQGSYNIELFAGAIDDSNAIFLWEGAMDVLRPYIDNGQLVVRSGQTDLKTTATARWREEKAEARMTEILAGYYADARVDAVLCPNDSTSYGVQKALKAVGYNLTDKMMPITTGQDADKKNIPAIMSGEQSMSIFKDTRLLARQTVNMVNAIIAGKEPETNDIGNYNNGVKILPTFLVRPQFVDKTNLEEIIFDSGYYNRSEFFED
ncbi:MAG: sugar-binding protein [Selenomonadaceae bacterium]|nr:sugar-binding protein [Selenomonadaceae bacterium]